MLAGLAVARLLVPTMLQQHEKEQYADDQEGKEEVSAQKEKICREGH